MVDCINEEFRLVAVVRLGVVRATKTSKVRICTPAAFPTAANEKRKFKRKKNKEKCCYIIAR